MPKEAATVPGQRAFVPVQMQKGDSIVKEPWGIWHKAGYVGKAVEHPPSSLSRSDGEVAFAEALAKADDGGTGAAITALQKRPDPQA